MNETPDISSIFSMISNNEDFKNKKPEEILAKLMGSNTNTTSNASSSETQTYNNNENNIDTSNKNFAKDFDLNAVSNQVPDIEMIMKIMKIMKSSNQNSPSKDLLNSLKPFLNDSRKEKVDQYVKIIGLTKALEMFNDLGDISK